MARYTDSVCRLCRREGQKLFLKGDRCYGPKCSVAKRPTPPGQHGQSRKKVSQYGIQLREKQKTRRAYGVLESQFASYFEKAVTMKGITGENLLSLLERRLDNVVYRLGFGESRAHARQMINHGHITVNGKKVDIPSYIVNTGDVISVKERTAKSEYFKSIREEGVRNLPKWLTLDAENLKGSVIALPQRDDIDLTIEEHQIVELYSR
ncbi:30S ribosomal protein S4 [Christensenella sp. MSJ-20]|jgi:small subunit ribosomal protein S4|uniref:30S ribosomal protein S4 n=1 Tax=Christensenella sp. MSJ-20 TaxID=2841518 RepID=UPI000D78CD74|nr:MAG: 30S ribosomal protein S4 [Bacillota bacterium]QWT55140.1 30S ribosomal protein S4 [Christensenella sp. MSJ-20]